MERSASHLSSVSKQSGAETGRTRFRKITLDTILSATSLTRSSKETHESYLQRVTHLHLQGKRIRTIDGLEMCTNLKVLYLYDNQVEAIQNLDFATQLQYLYLQNNSIKQIPPLTMKSLRKLHLDDNEIPVLTGLSECNQLIELNIARQRLPSFSSLQIDSQSLMAISYTLESIDISGNGISILSPFLVLYNLQKFICDDNNVMEIAEIEPIVAMPNMTEASFAGNPCCKYFKYRDFIISACADNLLLLDGIPVPKHQQIAIKGLVQHRHKMGTSARFHAGSQNSQSSYNPQEVGGSGMVDEDSFVIRGTSNL